jgi:hypothetical protein
MTYPVKVRESLLLQAVQKIINNSVLSPYRLSLHRLCQQIYIPS